MTLGIRYIAGRRYHARGCYLPRRNAKTKNNRFPKYIRRYRIRVFRLVRFIGGPLRADRDIGARHLHWRNKSDLSDGDLNRTGSTARRIRARHIRIIRFFAIRSGFSRIIIRVYRGLCLFKTRITKESGLSAPYFHHLLFAQRAILLKTWTVIAV